MKCLKISHMYCNYGLNKPLNRVAIAKNDKEWQQKHQQQRTHRERWRGRKGGRECGENENKREISSAAVATAGML